jgi:transcriptional regulator NrdR family protein
MVCVHCGGKTAVTNSRHQKNANQVWRRRACQNCGTVFTTEESAAYGGAWAVQSASGAISPFSRDKLLLSVHESLKHRPDALNDAAGVTATIIHKLSGVAEDGRLERQTIRNAAQVALNRFDKAASAHYMVFHAKRTIELKT